MTKRQAKDIAPIIKAYAQGKQIQRWNAKLKVWLDVDCPKFIGRYRIRPKYPYNIWVNPDQIDINGCFDVDYSTEKKEGWLHYSFNE